MQISTTNVLASQQQQAAKTQRSQPAPFEPLELKQTVARAAESPSAPAGYVRPGTHVDIKV